ncbi:MAG: hypothetical protein HYW02_01915 [Deltaproteobacteria bacterium]|nr:hypothetical protein [Deltaproteobacteria bacterium]
MQASSEISPVVRSFFRLTKNAEWKLVKTVPLSFETYHPQGMVKIGDFFYLSSVEVVEKTTQFLKPEGRYDRTTGKGRGYLFQFDQNGKLIGRLTLGEGASYHPGGIDYDGESLWVREEFTVPTGIRVGSTSGTGTERNSRSKIMSIT